MLSILCAITITVFCQLRGNKFVQFEKKTKKSKYNKMYFNILIKRYLDITFVRIADVNFELTYTFVLATYTHRISY